MHRVCRISVLLSGWVLIVVPATLGDFRNYSVADGLAQSQVAALLQDRQGALWVGTRGGGVSRFDGTGFETFTSADGLSSNLVQALYESRDGTIWVGTSRGLTRFDGRRFEAVPLGPEGRSPSIHDLLEDSRGHLWLGTDSGALEIDGERLRVLRREDGRELGEVRALAEDHEGGIWLGTLGGGALRWDGERLETLTSADGLPNDSVYSLLVDRQGDLWVGTARGVARFDGRAVLPAAEEASRLPVRALVERASGEIWIGTDGGGLCRIEGSGQGCLDESEGLGSDVVWSLLEDREGNLWIGTYRGGLDRFSEDGFTTLRESPALARDVVRAILEDRAGQLWFGTYRHGLIRFDGRESRTWTEQSGLADDFVLSLLEADSGEIWVGTVNGASRLDGLRSTSPIPTESLPDRVIRAIHEDAEGRIWLGTNQGGIAIWDGSRVERLGVEDGLSSNRINTFFSGGNGLLWIGTADGLSAVAGGRVVDRDSFAVLAGKNVYSVLEDDHGDLWLAAYGDGLVHCRMSSADGDPRGAPRPLGCVTLSARDGLISNTVVSLVLDRKGYLWIGTERGLSRLDAGEYRRSGRSRFAGYGSQEGFHSIECVHNAAAREESGRLWFGTVSGAVRYDPGQDRRNLVEPVTRITGMRVFFQREDLAEYAATKGDDTGMPTGLRLPWDRNHLTFDFIGVSLTAPSKVSYSYLLEGLDDSWSPPGRQRSATYSNIPAGRYTFKVQAANNDGLWNREPASYSFVIRPPLWRTWWFQMLGVVLALAGLLGFVRLRTRKLEQRRRSLQQQVEAATAQLQEKQQRLEQVNRELEDRVAARTRSLVEANGFLKSEIDRRKRLEQEVLRARNLESLALLAGGIAHDFNNLLTVIMGNISFARQLLPPDSEVEPILEEAQKASNRTRDLTRQLSTFAKGGAPVKQSVSLAELIEESASFALAGSPIKGEISLSESLWWVDADPGQISQVLHNLLLNAIEAMPAGGKIEIVCENLEVSHGEHPELRPGRYVRVVVRDEGVGIEGRNLERIFDPYFSTKEGGTGLGLATAYSIVRRHGGLIRVESPAGQGTKFEVYLQAAAPGTVSPDEEQPPAVRRGGRILVMDDEQQVRETAGRILEAAGFAVETVADGRAAIDLYRGARSNGSRFDLVLMDLTIPGGMGGREAIVELRGLDPEVRAILTSGYSDDPVLDDFRAHGFVGFLVKPFAARDLESAVMQAMPAALELSGARAQR